MTPIVHIIGHNLLSLDSSAKLLKTLDGRLTWIRGANEDLEDFKRRAADDVSRGVATVIFMDEIDART
jgi:hypothetical protein